MDNPLWDAQRKIMFTLKPLSQEQALMALETCLVLVKGAAGSSSETEEQR
jgi:hypothetical protein